MNREIKFRAWDKNKGFLKGYSAVECLEQTHNGTSDSVFLMQYTGLLDKHGKEIYEGDIVKINRNHNMFPINQIEGEFNVIVEYRDVMFYPLYIVGGDCEIIGNIYENPDLIK